MKSKLISRGKMIQKKTAALNVYEVFGTVITESVIDMYNSLREMCLEIDFNNPTVMQSCRLIDNFINNYNLDLSVQSFLNFSFQTIEGGKSHEIAAAFTFGREEIIPDMFIEIIEQTEKSKKVSLDKINYYLQRHIDLDGDEHGPLAHEMIIGLCQEDSLKWQEVTNVSIKALEERIRLWDYINESIKSKYHSENKIKNSTFANP